MARRLTAAQKAARIAPNERQEMALELLALIYAERTITNPDGETSMEAFVAQAFDDDHKEILIERVGRRILDRVRSTYDGNAIGVRFLAWRALAESALEIAPPSADTRKPIDIADAIRAAFGEV